MPYSGVWDTVVKVWRHEGILSFWRGFGGLSETVIAHCNCICIVSLAMSSPRLLFRKRCDRAQLIAHTSPSPALPPPVPVHSLLHTVRTACYDHPDRQRGVDELVHRDFGLITGLWLYDVQCFIIYHMFECYLVTLYAYINNNSTHVI